MTLQTARIKVFQLAINFEVGYLIPFGGIYANMMI